MDPKQSFSLAVRGPERFIVLNSDKAISKILYTSGDFDFEKVEQAVALVREVIPDFDLDLLVDIGANIGTVCIPAVCRSLAKRAIAFEPERTNFRLLVANIYLNDLAEKITTHNFALGAENNQILEFELSPSNSGDHRIRVSNSVGIHDEATWRTTHVRSETMDVVVPTMDRNSSLIWIDTQGYEGIVLQGAQRAVTSRIPMVVEFWPYGLKRANCFDALKAAMLNYRSFYDLSEKNPSLVEISAATVDALCFKLGDSGNWTDILLV
jgi:FkbM family methyltransferase